MKFGTVNKEIDRKRYRMNTTAKIGAGAVLSLVSAALILYVSFAGEPIIPGLIGSAAMLVLALGVLLLGTSGSDGRPV
jgi:hydrogenase-4 membrane subunit HyfE